MSYRDPVTGRLLRTEISSTQELEIVAKYRSGIGSKSLAAEYRLRGSRVPEILAEHGVEMRKQGLPKKVNPHVFDNGSAESGYFAGLLMADGSIGGHLGRTLTISLQESDSYMVKAFRDFLESDAVVSTRRVRKPSGEYSYHTRVTVTHKEFPDVLRTWGIVRDKTHNWVEPSVPKKLLNHYLRGWFDGDGNWSAGRSKWTVCVHPEAFDWYADSLRLLGYTGNVANGTSKDQRWIKILSVAGRRQTYQIRELLLEGGGPRLERKWNDFVPTKRWRTARQLSILLETPLTQMYRLFNENVVPHDKVGSVHMCDPYEAVEALHKAGYGPYTLPDVLPDPGPYHPKKV